MSVRKRILRTGRVRWVADYSDQHGKRRHKTFNSETDAKTFMKRTAVAILDNVYVADSATLSVQAACWLWAKAGQDAGLERTSVDQRLQHTTLHIVPYFGKTKLTKVTIREVRAFQSWMRANNRSPAMIRKVSSSLSGVLSEAREHGLISQNPMQGMKRVRHGADRHCLEVGVDIPTLDEIRRLIVALDGKWRPVILTAIFTGLRAGELRALKWQDVDLSNGVLHVRRSADKYGTIRDMAKSKAGTRSVPLPADLTRTLKEWKLRTIPGPLDLVFPGKFGRVMGQWALSEGGLIPAMLRAKLLDGEGRPKYPGMHALRHFFVSLCINRKVDGGMELPIKMVQQRVGHSSITMTLDRYGHLFAPVNDGQLDAAEALLMGK